MKKLFSMVFVIFALILIAGFVILIADNSSDRAENASGESESVPGQSDWRTVFLESGFTEDEIATYGEMLDEVGIGDFHDVEIIENGIMHIVRGKIYDSDRLQLNITLENRKIIYIELAGLPATESEAYINWRGKLKFKTVDTVKSVELYYDTDGGYQAKLDWENKTITAIE